MTNDWPHIQEAAKTIQALVAERWPLLDVTVKLEVKGPTLLLGVGVSEHHVLALLLGAGVSEHHVFAEFRAPRSAFKDDKDPMAWVLSRIEAVANLPHD